ncbi:AAEL014056-PA, partial [Aedes aegypti]
STKAAFRSGVQPASQQQKSHSRVIRLVAFSATGSKQIEVPRFRCAFKVCGSLSFNCGSAVSGDIFLGCETRKLEASIESELYRRTDGPTNERPAGSVVL